MMKLGRDLRAALAAEHRKMIAEQPISIETSDQPFARPLYLKDGGKEVRGVWVSAGFIDLVNRVAHAQAIESKAKRYFAKYARFLERGERPVPELPEISKAGFWADEVLNEQQSNFNSIVGLTVGMKLANHYLGHVEKYRKKLEEPSDVPRILNNLLTREEWKECFAQGVGNALRAGCMTEGAAPLLEALDGMKFRPGWAGYFIPDEVKFASVRKEMERMQTSFLAGDEK
jgi:hypothetical protein